MLAGSLFPHWYVESVQLGHHPLSPYYLSTSGNVHEWVVRLKWQIFVGYRILHEQWIRAKYERKEFIGTATQTYLSGHKEGYLWKRGKDDKHFKKRRFVLDATENTLKYFTKDDVGIYVSKNHCEHTL